MNLKAFEYLGIFAQSIIAGLIVGSGCYLLPALIPTTNLSVLMFAGVMLMIVAELIAKICAFVFVAVSASLLSRS